MKAANDQPKLLFLDIETRPAEAFVWGMRDQNVGVSQLKHPGGIICVGVMWGGQKRAKVYSEWEHGWHGMMEAIHAMISEADAVITYNGNKFDIPKLRGAFLLAGLKDPPPITSIDVYPAVRRLGFISNKLAFIGPHLGLESKVQHDGFGLWLRVMDGCPKSQRTMARYCAQDVRLLEQVYDKVKGYISNHPHLGFRSKDACATCGSHNVQSRGVRRTRASLIQRLQCMDCGSWMSGARAAA